MGINMDENQLARPLVVDLDGTLIKSNLLFEGATRFLCRYPFRFFYLLLWLMKGKSYLKAKLASIFSLETAMLPYNVSCLLWLREQKSLGRKLVLATASHRIWADAIANYLGLFDETMASEQNINLRSTHKRDVLIERYGEKSFDYIGNEKADLPIWKAAHTSHIVSSSSTLIDGVRHIGNLAEVFSDERPALFRSCLTVLRPHQWVKNLLIFIPLLAAHRMGHTSSVIHALIAFVIFSLMASSVYVLNDVVDIIHDRAHHLKCHRPFAAGHLSLLWGWGLAPCLFMTAFIMAYCLLPTPFLITLLTYFGLTLGYSFWMKQCAMLDVLVLAGLYTLRIVAGAAAIHVPLSFWLLTFSGFFFLSLAFIKRLTELKLARQSGLQDPIKGRGYVHHDLELVSSMGIAAGYMAILVLALYIQDIHTAMLYRSPQLIWLACPILLYWISRSWLIAHRDQMADDPVVFAIKDPVSWLVAICFLSVFVLAKVV